MKKSDIVIPTNPCNIEVGSKVVFVDGSYTMSIVDNKLTSTSLGVSDEIYTVIAVNVPCPSKTDSKTLKYLNNCIVSDDNGGIHFCSTINIKNIEHLFRSDRIVFKTNHNSQYKGNLTSNIKSNIEEESDNIDWSKPQLITLNHVDNSEVIILTTGKHAKASKYIRFEGTCVYSTSKSVTEGKYSYWICNDYIKASLTKKTIELNND